MNKIDILKKLLALSENNDISEISEEMDKLIKAFYAIYNNEKKESSEGTQPEDPIDEIAIEDEKINSEILSIINAYKAKKADILAAKKAEEKKNLELKNGIINEFTQLIESEENLSKLFESIKNIRERWNAIGNVPRDKEQSTQAEYSKLSERFNYNVNIYKELKENDLKKNYSLKNQIIHQAKELLTEKKIKEVEVTLRKLQNDWDEIGPTYKEHWENLKEEYWTTIKQLYEKIKSHYVDQKNKQKENLDKKLALIEKVKIILSKENKEHNEWDNSTKELLELQKEWKKIGNVPKEKNEEIWNIFRELYNNFFDEKSSFYEARKEVFNKKKDLKTKLINKAEELINSSDWKNASNQIIKLQKDWKEIGHAGQHIEQKLWKSFRSKCDAFFAARDEHYKKQDKENEDNLRLKESLIEKIKNYKHQKDANSTIADLKKLSTEFAEIGNVPFKKKDAVYKSYKDALDKQYSNLKVDESEKEKILFEAKIESIKGGQNPEKLFQIEKEKIRKKINDITKEVANYENNLGFFSNSKGAESLLKGVTENINKGKLEIEKLKRKLKLFPKD